MRGLLRKVWTTWPTFCRRHFYVIENFQFAISRRWFRHYLGFLWCFPYLLFEIKFRLIFDFPNSDICADDWLFCPNLRFMSQYWHIHLLTQPPNSIVGNWWHSNKLSPFGYAIQKEGKPMVWGTFIHPLWCLIVRSCYVSKPRAW